MNNKITALRLTLNIQETMIKLWTLRAKVTRRKIADMTRDSKKIAKKS